MQFSSYFGDCQRGCSEKECNLKACSTFTKGPLLSDIAFLGVLHFLTSDLQGEVHCLNSLLDVELQGGNQGLEILCGTKL